MKNHRDAGNCQSLESKVHSPSKAPFRRSLGSLLATVAVILTAITLSNCAGYTSASSTQPGAGAGVLAASATTLTFGSVAMGSTAVQSLSVTNTGTSAVNVTQATISGSGFSVTSGSGAATLAAGQSATVQVQFAPTSSTAMSANLVVASNASNPSLTIALSGTGTQAGISVTPSSVSFGNVADGTSATQTITLKNTGTASLVVSSDSVTGAGFSVTGFAAQTLTPSATMTFNAVFAPASSGSASGSISVSTNLAGSPTTIALTGTGTQPGMSVTPSSVSFGNVASGASSTQVITLKNTGTANLVVSSDGVTGTGFSVTGFVAQTLTPSATMTFNAVFAPTSSGSASGSISVSTNLAGSPTAIALTGTGTQPGVSVTPSSVSFGNVVDGASATQVITVKDTGTANLVVSSENVTGTGFSVTGFVAQTLAPNTSMTFNAVFAPTSTGAASGSISVSTSASGSATTIALSGTGTQPAMSVTPSSVSFGSVADGTNNSQTITLKNTGTANLVVSSESVTGTGFSVTGFTAQTVTPNNTMAFNAVFAPASAGSVTGSISLNTNVPGSPTAIGLSGTGTAATFSLGASPTTLSFGTVNVGSNSSLGVTLKNNGNSNITISGISGATGAFSTSGAGAGTTLTPNQSTTLNVTFTPTTSGAASATTITIASNSTTSPSISVSGTAGGAAPSVNLSWTPSSSSDVVGYNVYRGTVSGGPYTKLTSSPVASSPDADSTVSSGQTYYYVVTAVDSSNNESADSNQAVATIP